MDSRSPWLFDSREPTSPGLSPNVDTRLHQGHHNDHSIHDVPRCLRATPILLHGDAYVHRNQVQMWSFFYGVYCMYIYIYVCVTIYIYVCVCVSMRMYKYMYSCNYIWKHPSVHPSIHPFIHSSIHPFIHPSSSRLKNSCLKPLGNTLHYDLHAKDRHDDRVDGAEPLGHIILTQLSGDIHFHAQPQQGAGRDCGWNIYVGDSWGNLGNSWGFCRFWILWLRYVYNMYACDM